MAKDPVCGITLDNKAPYKSIHAGQIHVFCCATCKTTFDKEPGRYVAFAGVALVTQRPPSGPPASPFVAISSIGHLLQVFLPKSVSNEFHGRPTWFFASRRSRDGRQPPEASRGRYARGNVGEYA
jgi:YHS domain-containing protein